MWTCKLDGLELGISRAGFSRALSAEGFPNAEGYVPPIYLIPLFQRRIAIGSHGFPFNLSDRTYPRGLCPVAEKMHDLRVLQFQPVSWQADDEQVDMLIDAIRKVHGNAGVLAEAAE
jgi:hypothetical protein